MGHESQWVCAKALWCVWEKHCHRLAALGGFEFRLGPLQAKQHCGCWSFGDKEAGLWLTPLSAESAVHPSARRRQQVCSPAMCGAVWAPQEPTCSLCPPPPLPAYRWAICPCPQQHAHSLGSSCGPSWSLWGEESRQERRQQARGECLNTGTIWGSSLIFSLKLVRPPGL